MSAFDAPLIKDLVFNEVREGKPLGVPLITPEAAELGQITGGGLRDTFWSTVKGASYGVLTGAAAFTITVVAALAQSGWTPASLNGTAIKTFALGIGLGVAARSIVSNIRKANQRRANAQAFLDLELRTEGGEELLSPMNKEEKAKRTDRVFFKDKASAKPSPTPEGAGF